MRAPLRELAELIARESGIRMSEHQDGALRAALARAAPGMEPAAFLRMAADPARRGAALGRLLDEVTVQETFFFREREPLEALRWHDLLATARAGGDKEVRVWVAACATGEEAYTLAILAREAFVVGEPPVSILATDLSHRALAAARAGIYRERSVRDVDPERRERWLRPRGAQLAVREELRRMVRFRRHNLAQDPAPPPGEVPFHLIVCRNVLIYFDAEGGERVRRSLEGALAPGGRLVLGSADALTGATRRLDALREARPVDTRAPRARRARAEPTRDERLARAMRAADEGRSGDALADVGELLRRDRMDADAHFLRGLVELADGDPEAAAGSLRRALYLDPGFGVAAFTLARAHDAGGRPAAARAAYARALRSLRPDDDRHAALLGQIDVADIAAACRARLEGADG